MREYSVAELIELAEKHGLVHVKVGPIELTFAPKSPAVANFPTFPEDDKPAGPYSREPTPEEFALWSVESAFVDKNSGITQPSVEAA